MVLKSGLLAVLNTYGSGKLNEVTILFWAASSVACERQILSDTLC